MRMRVGRRTMLAGGLALVLAGCGKDERPDPAGAAVTISHQYGTASIPAGPGRVVTMNGGWTDALIALGVPITGEFVVKGYAGKNNRFEWTPEHASQVVETASDGETDLEKLAGFDPEVILAGYVSSKELYEKYAAIAPTVPVMDPKAVLDTWQNVTHTAGRIFGQEDKAEELVAGAERQITAFRASVPVQGGTFVFGQRTADGQFGLVAADNDPAAKLITAATGLRLSPKVKTVAKGGERVLVGAEQVGLLDADLILMWPLAGGPEQFGKVPGWNALPAVRSGAVVWVTNDNAAAFGNPTVLSVPYTLDLLRPAVDRAAKR